MKNFLLIFHNNNNSTFQGGPNGFINKCLDNENYENIIIAKKQEKSFLKLNTRQKTLYFTDFLKSKIITSKNVFGINRYFNEDRKLFIKSNASGFKLIFFHDIFTLFNVIDMIQERQIVILQSHSPILPFEELFGPNHSKDLIKIQSEIFSRANYLIFPNKESTKEYNSVIKNQKVIYLNTGIKEIAQPVNLGLDKEQVKILYVGRRNSVKGFDELIKQFKKVRLYRKDITLYLIGEGEKIFIEGVIDLGFSKLVLDWVNSVDFVISPNRKSYFDLNILETIQIGTPLIMTTSEGHTCFSKIPGIVSIELNNLSSVLLNREIINTRFKKEYSANLKQYFRENYTQKIYLERLEEIITKII